MRKEGNWPLSGHGNGRGFAANKRNDERIERLHQEQRKQQMQDAVDRLMEFVFVLPDKPSS